jgi:hypothetical protein
MYAAQYWSFLIVGAADLCYSCAGSIYAEEHATHRNGRGRSALCWWPVIIQPNLDLPIRKTPLISLALITSLATALSDEGAGWLMSASILGVFAGSAVVSGFGGQPTMMTHRTFSL